MKRQFKHNKVSIQELLISKNCIRNIFVLTHFTLVKIKWTFVTLYSSCLISKIGKGVRFKSIPHILYPYIDVEIGNNVIIGNNLSIQTVKGSAIRIGDNVSINDNCFITALFGIEIGRGTSIAENVSIRDFNHSLPR